jgi:hypothetical protein
MPSPRFIPACGGYYATPSLRGFAPKTPKKKLCCTQLLSTMFFCVRDDERCRLKAKLMSAVCADEGAQRRAIAQTDWKVAWRRTALRLPEADEGDALNMVYYYASIPDIFS